MKSNKIKNNNFKVIIKSNLGLGPKSLSELDSGIRGKGSSTQDALDADERRVIEQSMY